MLDTVCHFIHIKRELRHSEVKSLVHDPSPAGSVTCPGSLLVQWLVQGRLLVQWLVLGCPARKQWSQTLNQAVSLFCLYHYILSTIAFLWETEAYESELHICTPDLLNIGLIPFELYVIEIPNNLEATATAVLWLFLSEWGELTICAWKPLGYF